MVLIGFAVVIVLLIVPAVRPPDTGTWPALMPAHWLRWPALLRLPHVLGDASQPGDR